MSDQPKLSNPIRICPYIMAVVRISYLSMIRKDRYCWSWKCKYADGEGGCSYNLTQTGGGE